VGRSVSALLIEVLADSWEACKDADVIIESPSAMAGVHIAEALKIPYFRAFTMPWTRTQAYPQAFMVPAFEMGPSFNYSTYVLFDNIMWKATSGQINRWRKKQLSLKATDVSTLSVNKVPFLYNFSSAVVPKPLDWHDDITITGYWTLENSDTEWTPPADLERFMAKAKEDGKALVYIVGSHDATSLTAQGFGSIVVPRPNAMTKSIIRAVEKGVW
jgi:sterol 3beta-glucosyltransferase